MTNANFDRITVPAIQSRKADTAKITALTAYDYTMARLLDAAGVDIILVGDSVGSVVQGHETTLPVTLEEMIYHSRCVSRAVKRALLVSDMPFLSYQVSVERAIESAGRLLKEGGAQAVKLEGGTAFAATIERLVAIDIPVMGHIGLTPQSYHRMGGHKVQGRKHSRTNSPRAGTWEKIIADAKAVEAAGAFSLVIEGVPAELAKEITNLVSIPTIGIGAGADCDGQILVCTDLLGMSPESSPKFVKRYVELHRTISGAVDKYLTEVRGSKFPSAEHEFREAGPKLKVASTRRA